MSSQRRDHEVSRRDFLKLAALLPLLKLELPAFGQASNPQLANQPNILVLVFDTLSARHLPIYGYHATPPPISLALRPDPPSTMLIMRALTLHLQPPPRSSLGPTPGRTALSICTAQ
jgi:hypothetical protein